MEPEHEGKGKQERDDDVLGGEHMKKYVTEMGGRCESYMSIITSLSENKTKEEIEGLGKTHLSYKYRTVWEFLGLTNSGKLVTYKGKRILTPRGARKDVILVAHSKHTGVQNLSRKIRKHFYWPQLDEDVRNILRSCKECSDWGEVD